MFDSKLIIELVASVGTFLSMLFVLFTLLEMQKQRKLIYQPDLVIRTVQEIVVAGVYGLSEPQKTLPKATEWYSIKNRIEGINKDISFNIELENISNSTAKNIVYGFSGKDIENFLTKVSDNDDNILIKNNKKDKILEYKYKEHKESNEQKRLYSKLKKYNSNQEIVNSYISMIKELKNNTPPSFKISYIPKTQQFLKSDNKINIEFPYQLLDIMTERIDMGFEHNLNQSFNFDFIIYYEDVQRIEYVKIINISFSFRGIFSVVDRESFYKSTGVIDTNKVNYDINIKEKKLVVLSRSHRFIRFFFKNYRRRF